MFPRLSNNPTPSLTRGFTLIEILVVIGIITILASTVIVAVNPQRQFAQARNAQRTSDVNAILTAIGSRIAEKSGTFAEVSGVCASSLPSEIIEMGTTAFNIRECLVPNYLADFPVDPVVGYNFCTTSSCDTPTEEGYASGYTIQQNVASGRITVCAPQAAEPSLSGSTEICMSR